MSNSALQVTPNDLVVKFTGYSEAIAHQMVHKLPIKLEDAISAGHLGLVEAANRFDFGRYDPKKPSSLDTNFKSFAYMRIRGAIIDASRNDSFVRRRGLEKGIKISMSSLDRSIIGPDGSSSPAFEIPVWDNTDEHIDLLNALGCLNDREREILIGMASGYSGRDMAERFGITQSRISQISNRAKTKVKEALTADN